MKMIFTIVLSCSAACTEMQLLLPEAGVLDGQSDAALDADVQTCLPCPGDTPSVVAGSACTEPKCCSINEVCCEQLGCISAFECRCPTGSWICSSIPTCVLLDAGG